MKISQDGANWYDEDSPEWRAILAAGDAIKAERERRDRAWIARELGDVPVEPVSEGYYEIYPYVGQVWHAGPRNDTGD